MSYISSWRIGDDVCVWERTDQGRITKRFPAPLHFYTKSSKGQYRSVYKEPLEQHTFNTWSEFSAAKNRYSQSGIPLYESDIGPELKVLSKHYHEVKAPKLHFTLWDIEVDYQPDQGFSSVENPYAPINAVAVHHFWSGESVVIAVPPKVKNWEQSDIDEIAKQSNATIHIVPDERTLLRMLLDQFEDSDCISGWNSDFFDTPYLAKRVEMVLGKSHVKRMSFRDSFAPRWREVEQFGTARQVVDLGGRISWDYMELFKKFEMSERPSYSLEAISNEILPDLPKLSYPGTLHQLYNDDFAHFVRYNVRDTEVLKGFEDKLGYMQLANELYHSACSQPRDIFGTIRLTDLSIVNHCHYKLNQIVPDLDLNAIAGRITGAMVLVPKRGLHQHIGSIDITSLYPSAMRCVNISPDTLIGQFDGHLTDDDRAKHTGWEKIYTNNTTDRITLTYDERVEGYSGSESHTGAEWREIFEERNWAVSGYGTVFRQDKQGIIPAVLTEWFARRKQYKRLMAAAKDAVGDMEKQYPVLSEMPADVHTEFRKQKELAEYYDRLQYVYKIRLNSSYGATANQYFRFFDLRLGQSTTGTGRAILEHMCAQAALELDGVYDMKSKSIVYGDSVAGDTTVYTSTNEDVNIESLFTTVDRTIGEKDYHHPSNLQVLTYDEPTNQSCYKPVKYIMRHKNTKQMYRVWMTNATYIDVTEDHSLMGYVNTKIRKKGESCLREIKPQEFGTDINRLIQMKSRPRTTIDSHNLSKEMYELLGLIVGDGGANHRSSGIELSIGKQDMDEIKRVLVDPLIEQGWCTSFHIMKNGHDVRLCGTRLWDTVRSLLYVDNQKRVPLWLNDEHIDNIRHFLRGYFTADGGVTGNAIRLTSTIIENVQRVQRLLTYCGVASNYFTETTENSYKGKFSGTHSTNLVVKSKLQFRDTIGFLLTRKQQAIPSSGRKDSHFANIDFDLTGVVHIEPIEYTDYVYDIEVEDTHTFFANNVLVHNTDSVYFKTNAESFPGTTLEEQCEKSIKIADAIGKRADASFDKFCKQAFCINDEFSGIIKCDREVVAKSGIFVTKKRYVLKLIDLDGYKVDKLKAMGLEMKKTTTPKIIQKFLEDVVNMILDGEATWDEINEFIVDYRKQVHTELPMLTIGLPKGVKKVEHYTKEYQTYGEKTRLPGHVAASIFYNSCLKHFNDQESLPIVSNMKIKVFYLTQKYGKFKSIAIPTDAEHPPAWFEENFAVDREKHEQRLIDNNLQIIFTAIDRQVPTRQTMFDDSMLEW